MTLLLNNQVKIYKRLLSLGPFPQVETGPKMSCLNLPLILATVAAAAHDLTTKA